MGDNYTPTRSGLIAIGGSIQEISELKQDVRALRSDVRKLTDRVHDERMALAKLQTKLHTSVSVVMALFSIFGIALRYLIH